MPQTISKKHWYLVIVQFSGAHSGLVARLTQDVPAIEDALKALSGNHFKLIARSENGQTAIWAVRTLASVSKIGDRVRNPQGNESVSVSDNLVPDTIRRGDKVMVFQLGDERWLLDMNTIRDWLDRFWTGP